MTTSTTSDEPLSSARGVSTRVIWMSRVNRSCPTPTVNTGMDRAFRLASDWSSEASDVSAPSVTMTSPASGRPDSSSRARSSASPSFVDVPSYLSSDADPRRPAEVENLKKRRTKRCCSALRSALSMPPRSAWTNWLRGWPSRSAIQHAARVVHQNAQKFAAGTAASRMRIGLIRQNRSTATRADAQADEHGLVSLDGPRS